MTPPDASQHASDPRGSADLRQQASDQTQGPSMTPPNNSEGLVKRLEALRLDFTPSSLVLDCIEDAVALITSLQSERDGFKETMEQRGEALNELFGKLGAAQSRVVELEGALLDAAASLAAAVSLLQRSPKVAAPSNKMFDQMVRDYEASLHRARAALSPNTAGSGGAEPSPNNPVADGQSTAEGWRPIETAPRDGRHILLAFGQDIVCEGWWDDNDLEPRPWKFVDTGGPGATALGFVNSSRDEAYGPSHWRPLPPPPSAAPCLDATGQGRDGSTQISTQPEPIERSKGGGE